MNGEETVWLDAIDGFEFEKVCARIFEKLGYGHVEDIVDVADKGRDLIIHATTGKIVVECKHQPKSSIGRPVIQKLHSAVITEGAQSGMLITTGTFSKQASDYASELSEKGFQVKLVGRALLADLAHKAGIRLLGRGAPGPVVVFQTSVPNVVKEKLIAEFAPRIRSQPHSSETLLATLRPEHLVLNPLYIVTYDVHHDFKTTVGVVHSLHLDGMKLLLDGQTGELVSDLFAQFVDEAPTREQDSHNATECKVERRPFSVNIVRLKRAAKLHIKRRHTTTVRYRGRGRVSARRRRVRYRQGRVYSKVCKPGDRSIYLSDISQALLPIWSFETTVVKRSYSVSCLEHPRHLTVLDTDLLTCRLCSKAIPKMALACNACGNIVHPPSLIKRHAYCCAICKKTICKECTYWVRRWLLFKQKICEYCADAMRQEKGTRKRKFIP